MNTYKELKALLLKLCQKEGLHLREEELKNKKICFVRLNEKNAIIINKNYHWENEAIT